MHCDMNLAAFRRLSSRPISDSEQRRRTYDISNENSLNF